MPPESGVPGVWTGFGPVHADTGGSKEPPGLGREGKGLTRKQLSSTTRDKDTSEKN